MVKIINTNITFIFYLIVIITLIVCLMKHYIEGIVAIGFISINYWLWMLNTVIQDN